MCNVRPRDNRKLLKSGTYKQTKIEQHEEMFTEQKTTMVWYIERIEDSAWPSIYKAFKVGDSLFREQPVKI